MEFALFECVRILLLHASLCSEGFFLDYLLPLFMQLASENRGIDVAAVFRVGEMENMP